MTTTKARCRECGRTMKPSRHSTLEAETIHQGHGLCTADYARMRRATDEPKRVEPLAPVESGRAADILTTFLTARRRRGVPATGFAVAS